jgi:DNA-binding SARP family transcriptional activator
MVAMRFGLLGSLEVTDEQGELVDVGGARSRALLMILLLARGRTVPADTIVDQVWGVDVPSSATSTLQSYVSRLRRVLEPDRPTGAVAKLLTWEAPGYRLAVDPDDVDIHRFERLADAGHAALVAGDPATARELLLEAESLRRGPALVEFAGEEWARGTAARLDERYLAAVEDRVAADLLLGRHDLVVGELADFVDQHPLREGLWEQLALALYRSNRQSEALRALNQLRETLLDELGVDPGPSIRELERRILDHDPSLRAAENADPHADAMPPTGTAADPVATPSPPSPADLVDASRPVRSAGHVPGVDAEPFVGRERERATVSAVLDDALQGRTQWVVIEGEPGIGKTRLAEELSRLAVERGFDVLWGRAYEAGTSPAFWPWLQPIRALNDPQTAVSDAAHADLLERLSGSGTDDTAAAPVDPGRYRLFEAITALLEHAASRQPRMILLDDAQWSDPASLGLVDYLTGRLVGSPIVFVLTVRQLEIGRQDELTQTIAGIARRPHAVRVRLRPLDRHQSEALARQALGGDTSAAVIDAINERCEGNPFFIGELARLLASEEGLTSAELVRRAGVPAGVRDVVHRRLARLPAATLDLLQLAAVTGRDVHVHVLSAAAQLSIEECLEHLDPAMALRVITDVPNAPSSVRFAHALVREAVLDDMSSLRRARLHMRVAGAMEAVGAVSDDEIEILADHLWSAGSLAPAASTVAALRRAAEVAVRRFSYETADGLLDRALQLVDASGGTGEDHALLELELTLLLITIRRQRYGFERARMLTSFARAKELAIATGRLTALTELLWTEWAAAATACDFERGSRVVADIEELAARSGDPRVSATSRSCRGIQLWHLGRIDEARQHLEQSLDEWNTAPSPADGADSAAALEHQLMARNVLSVVRALQGDPEPGGSPLPALAAGIEDPYGRVVVWVFEAARGIAAGDFEAAARAGEAALAIEVDASFEFFRAGAEAGLGVAQMFLGNVEPGMERIRRALDVYDEYGGRTFYPLFQAMLGVGEMLLGRGDEAGEWISRAKQTLAATGERWLEPQMMMAEAWVRHGTGAGAEVTVPVFRAAIELASAQGAHGTVTRIRELADLLAVTIAE